jgi:dTDP-4-dehydrorhamnose reductase
MRGLILGGAGQLGTSLRTHLGEVAAPTRAVLDLADFDKVRECLHDVAPTLVINCAAYNAVDKAESDVEGAMRINRDLVAFLGEQARDRFELITYSTDYVFDGTLDRPVTEADETNPLSVYGRSKLEGERALLALDAPALIFRTAWVWSLTHPSFISTMLKLGRERDSLKVVADQIGNPTYAPDLADATVAIIKQGGLREKRGVYHLAGATAVSRHEFAKQAIERDPHHKAHTIEPVPTSAFPTPAKRPSRVVLDCSKVRNTFGLEVPGYEDALHRCLPGTN